jgi:arachidonate 15-lipoxygenase
VSTFLSRALYRFGETVWPQKIALPQKVRKFGSWRRRGQLRLAREDYQFSYTHVSALAIVNKVPIRDELHFGWLSIVADNIVVALENRAHLEDGIEAAKYHREKHGKLRNLVSKGLHFVGEIREIVHDVLRFNTRPGAHASAAKALEDYAQLFRTIGLPPIAKDYQNDYAFAEMRVSGPNPVMIQRVLALDDRFPVTDAMFRVGAPGDSLDAAIAEARLYVADYAILDGAETGTFPNGTKYLAAPIALFVVEKTTRLLKPVAIQCRQKPGPKNPIFLPDDGWNWQIAKAFVEIADSNLHEAMVHLGRTHLAIEPFVVSTLRQLAEAHPLSHLLRPHFVGTMAINKASWRHLIAEKGGVEQLFSASLPAARGLAVQAVQSLDVMGSLLPNTFAGRGVHEASALPHYPYRDDTLLYWKAIQAWVKSYLGLYYVTEADLLRDSEMQAWARELAAADGGRVKGLPNGGAIRTLAELVDLVTFVIYTASVQHAAVNFPQYERMSYVPNMPLSAYRPPPDEKTGATEADYLATLPTLDMAELQMELGYLLGDVYYTELGTYDPGAFGHDRRVAALLKQFQHSIAGAGVTIHDRNAERWRPYTTLLPEGIPQSINI